MTQVELMSTRGKSPTDLAVADFLRVVGRTRPKPRSAFAQLVLKPSPQTACQNMSCRAMLNASQFRGRGKQPHGQNRSVPCASIVWLARAVKVERPSGPRLHRARFAGVGRCLGNTPGIRMTGLRI